ncbi:hypothetical protein Tco_0105187 [Tanacetum coccineum]
MNLSTMHGLTTRTYSEKSSIMASAYGPKFISFSIISIGSSYFDEPEPQPQLLSNCPSLDASIGNERGPEPPIKPPSPDSFRLKQVDHLTIHTPPSPHVASFHLNDTHCYYHPCIDDPKKLYGFKPGLLGQSGSLCVDFSNMEMIEDDWELEPKEVSFLERRLNLPVMPKEVENVIFDEKKLRSS